VLAVRAHPDILAKQKLPPKLVGKDIWKERFEDSAPQRLPLSLPFFLLPFFGGASAASAPRTFRNSARVASSTFG
jgi:hypothetical protein